MQEIITSNQTQHIFNTYNIMATFFKSIQDWMKEIYPEQATIDIQLFDNQIRLIRNNNYEGMKIQKDPYPFIIIEPELNLQVDDRTSFFWKYAPYTKGMQKDINQQIFQNDYIQIYPSMNTIKGNLNIYFLWDSIYQLFDQSILLHQYFQNANLGRVNEYYDFDFDVAIDENLFNLHYLNDKGEEVKLEWTEGSGLIKLDLIQSTYKYVKYFRTRPRFKAVSLSDSSQHRQKLQQNEFRLILSLEFEVSLPTMFTIVCRTKITKMPNILFSSTNPTLVKNERIDFGDYIIYNGTNYTRLDIIQYEVKEDDIGNNLRLSLPEKYKNMDILVIVMINNEVYNVEEDEDGQLMIGQDQFKEKDIIKFVIYKEQ